MRSGYKKLGPYIQPVDVRNSKLEVDLLLGVSVQKIFIPSIANTVGTDFSKYKIVRRKQFTYISDTSRRGDKIGLALLDDFDEALVSQAYSVFEIIDHNELDPEYLMMWFRRPEFDRYARFRSHGSVREIFDWEEMCEVELPIPPIEKQREMVTEYNTIVNRIQLNEQLNIKLEETAQALYKHWFVDFEFPDENGKPYKSSGGKMVWCEELDKEIPEGWEVEQLINVTDLINRGIAPKYCDEKGTIVINQKCVRNNTVNLSWSRLHNSEIRNVPEDKKLRRWDILVNSTGTGTLGRVGLFKSEIKDVTVDTHVTILRPNSRINPFYLWATIANNTGIIEELGEGSTGQTELSRDNLGALKIINCNMEIQLAFAELFLPVIMHSISIENYEDELVKLKDLLLSRMTRVEVEDMFHSLMD